MGSSLHFLTEVPSIRNAVIRFSFASQKSTLSPVPILRTTQPFPWPRSHNWAECQKFHQELVHWIGAAPALWEARLCPLTISIDPSWPSWKAKVPDSIPLLWHCWAQFCSQRHSGHSPTSPSQGQMIRIYIIHPCRCSPPYHWLDKAECKLGTNFWMTETDLNCRQASPPPINTVWTRCIFSDSLKLS